jgi:hypothetical protein
VASILATVASVLTWIASARCSFYEADGLGIGLWRVEDPFFNAFFTDDFFTDDFNGESSSNACFSWNSRSGMKELLDPPMQFARVLSAVASLSSVVVWIFILLPACVTLPRMFMKSLAIYMFFLSFILMFCLVSRTRFIRVSMLIFDEPRSHDSGIYFIFVSGGPGFGYLH